MQGFSPLKIRITQFPGGFKSKVFLAALLSVLACNTPLLVLGEAALHEDTNTAGQETIWYSQTH